VGGIKEKVLAAHRSGVRTLILPAWNRKDLEDIPKNVREDIRFHFVDKMAEVLDLAIEPRPAEPRKGSKPSGARQRKARNSKGRSAMRQSSKMKAIKK
jgi:ATP-dependent Lon protease